jgi:oxygen-independent coproporphyrinogen-3 oxidase
MEISSDSLRHLYVHIPFCNGKCIYCANYSELYTKENAIAFLRALRNELKILRSNVERWCPETIYIGGGSPTVLDERDCAELIDILFSAVDMRELKEWTVEVVPGSVSSDKVEILRQAGVNRVSVGAQSFDDSILQWAGRRHNVAEVIRTVEIIRKSGINNVGIDIISGFPGITLQTWQHGVAQAIELKPCHISVYALTVEEGSRLYRLYAGKKFIIDEREDIELLREAEHQLSSAGYVRYEISNYALPGYECRHNVSYWRGEDYLGAGPGATSRCGLYRRTNKPVLKRYIEALESGKLPPSDVEKLSPDADITERFIFAFRLREGIDINSFVKKAPHLINPWMDVLTMLQKEGLVESNGTRWFLTSRGREMADHVARELIVTRLS